MIDGGKGGKWKTKKEERKRKACVSIIIVLCDGWDGVHVYIELSEGASEGLYMTEMHGKERSAYDMIYMGRCK